jgi:hypothetical protein
LATTTRSCPADSGAPCGCKRADETWAAIQTSHVSNKPKPPLAVDVDQIGMPTWIIGVLIVVLKFELTANRQPGFVYAVELAGIASYTIGLALVTAGVLHVLWTHIKARLATSPAARPRYAKPAFFPLWYHAYGIASERQAAGARHTSRLKFDHGRASTWGVEYLIAAAVIQAAIQLTAQHAIWPQVGWLVACIPVRAILLAMRDHVTAHGHGHAAG